MSSLSSKFKTLEELFNYLSKSDFSGHNFLDLKAKVFKEGKIQYQTSEDPLSAASFISEDGSIHLYGTDSERVSNLLKEKILTDSLKNQASIFTTEPLVNFVNEQIPNYKPVFDFEYHRKPINTNPQSLPANREYRFLDPDNPTDLAILKQWYEAYNKEMETNWNVPDINSGQRHIVMLNKDSNEPLGFVSLTLDSDQRLWFGRFFVPKLQRGKGVSVDLLNYLDHIALKENKELSLLVHTDNDAALKLYGRSGYEKVDKIVVLGQAT